jgi:hypothetical protein
LAEGLPKEYSFDGHQVSTDNHALGYKYFNGSGSYYAFNVTYTIVVRWIQDIDGSNQLTELWVDPVSVADIAEAKIYIPHGGVIEEDRCCLIPATTFLTYFLDDLVTAEFFSDLIGGSVHGDPHFVGFHGQRYDVSGEDGEVYNLITQGNLQFNSRFVACPEDHAEAGPDCVVNGEFGIKTPTDQVFISRDGLVERNGAAVAEGSDDDMVTVESAGDVIRVTVYTEDYVFTAEAVRGLELNLVAIEELNDDPENERTPHGLIGHTHIEEEYPDHADSFRYLEGSLEDYRVKSNEIFADDFEFNMF